jgi:pyrroloquinoline quinone (PQQ) biosynthesis protein C
MNKNNLTDSERIFIAHQARIWTIKNAEEYIRTYCKGKKEVFLKQMGGRTYEEVILRVIRTTIERFEEFYSEIKNGAFNESTWFRLMIGEDKKGYRFIFKHITDIELDEDKSIATKQLEKKYPNYFNSSNDKTNTCHKFLTHINNHIK